MSNCVAMANSRPVLAITTGEPAGIGPEIALRAAHALRHEVQAVLLGDAAFLAMVAGTIDPAIELAAMTPMALRNGGLPRFGLDRIAVLDCPLAVPVYPGILDARNGRYVLHTLDLALEGCSANWFDAMVTAPLQKSTINQAGVAFTGHTEYLAEKTGTEQVVMMLAGPRVLGPSASDAAHGAAGPASGAKPSEARHAMLRVALATTHLPLAAVAQAITREGLMQTLTIIDHDLKRHFGLPHPRILVCGLNPHAGENGFLGREEIDIIGPVLQLAREMGIDARGPYPADTLFQPKYLDDADCVLSMYHDQGLPVLKYASFGRGVNITLGLPLIRTSVDHGTALDLAARGVGAADDGSMQEAMRVAAQMVNSRSKVAG
jgi:4-hydroxythreonine-4-phosphate dehydrogenase